MASEDWRQAAPKHRVKKLGRLARRFGTKEDMRRVRKAAVEFEDWLLTDEGQAALELLDASEAKIYLNASKEPKFKSWYVDVNGCWLHEGVYTGNDPTVEAIKGAIVADAIEKAEDFLSYIKSELDKIAKSTPA